MIRCTRDRVNFELFLVLHSEVCPRGSLRLYSGLFATASDADVTRPRSIIP